MYLDIFKVKGEKLLIAKNFQADEKYNPSNPKLSQFQTQQICGKTTSRHSKSKLFKQEKEKNFKINQR